MKALKLAVAEPSAILRCGIIAVLRRLPAPDVDILEIADISQLTAQLSRHRPDVLVVNPASLGFCTPQQLRVQTGCEGLRCIALQMSVTDAATLNAYDDVLSVYDPVETLREKIMQPVGDAPREERQEPLSAREREIVVCIVKGMTNKQIADALCISTHTVTSLNKAFILGIALNVAFVVVEFAVGLYYGSMGLLSDAGHNLSDVASLLLAMLAFRLAQAHATPRYTYGYKKSTVLISLLNSVILLVAVGVIVAESVGRMLHPAPVEGGAIAWTAGVGVVINGFTAWLFMKDKDKDLNVKGAYLHMAADALVSVGVLVSGVVISWTGWTIVDPVVGLVVAAVIVASVWSLTRDSLRLSLDGVPVGIRIEEVEKTMEAVPGVKAVHHIHVWAISTTENALTAHVVLAELPRMETVKRQLKAELETAGIHHVTLEFESSSEHCPGTCD